MISNERHWPSYGLRQPQPYYERPQSLPPRPTLREETLETRELQIERKHFLALLKENPRGRFVRISEEANGRYNSIMVPGDGLKEFLKMLQEVANASDEIPTTASPSGPQTLP